MTTRSERRSLVREVCNHLVEASADEARWAKVFSKSLITAFVKNWNFPVIIELSEQFWKHTAGLFKILGEIVEDFGDSLKYTQLLRVGDVGTIQMVSTIDPGQIKIFGEEDRYGMEYEGGRAIDIDFAKKLLVYQGEIELAPNNIAGEVAAILASRKEKVRLVNLGASGFGHYNEDVPEIDWSHSGVIELLEKVAQNDWNIGFYALQELPVDVAKIIASTKTTSLELQYLRKMSIGVARKLAAYRPYNEYKPDVVSDDRYCLQIGNLDGFYPEEDALCEFNDLCCSLIVNGLINPLSQKEASALAKHGGHRLSLSFTDYPEASVLEKLAGYQHELDLGSLSNYEDAYDGNTLTDERANALSNFEGIHLRINAFKGLSDKAAESLSKLTSRLELVNGEGMSQNAYSMLEDKGVTLSCCNVN
ncbi:hypothetical protein N9M57_03175 [Opitutales bacterium]|nr:hypothetical protein [Opitutales bacterium]